MLLIGIAVAMMREVPRAVPDSSPAHAVALTVEHLVDPIGVDAARPRFSWQIDDSRQGAAQSAYQLLVASDSTRLAPRRADVWNSGVVRGNATIDVVYGGTALQPRHRYYWTVCTRDQDGAAGPCAAPATFETGMMGTAWRGRWIAASMRELDTLPHDPLDGDTIDADGAGRPPLLRKAFTLPFTPVRARIYVVALGGYRLSLNGAPVGKGVLTPDWTDYRDRITYQSYDVTSQLHRGANAIGAMLGEGWYASPMGFSPKRHAFGPPPVRIRLELHAWDAAGREMIVASDSSWRTAPGPVLISEIYNGESYDARLEQPAWNRPDFDASGWRPALQLPGVGVPLQTQAMPLIEETDSIRPVRRWSPAPATYVFDLGQNIAGWARLHVQGPRGTHVRLRFAEILAPDSVNITQVNLRSAKATDRYVLSGRGAETFEPHFTYHGFRYIEVTGYPGPPSLDDVIGVVVHTALPETGTFVTSDSLLNRLWDNIRWTQRANLYGIPTDCPQRDERLGWMGDAQVFWRTASYNMDMSAFGEKWMADVRDGQQSDGCFPDFAPNFLGVLTCGAPGWADAGVIIPWTLWRQYGDTTVVTEQWQAMSHYMRFIADSNPDDLWVHRKTTEFGDWLPAGSTSSWGHTNTDLISTAYWAHDADLLAQMAGALGRHDDSVRYQQLFGRIRNAFVRAYVLPDGRIGAPFVNPDKVASDYTQTSTVLALRFGLVPDSLRAAAAAQLVDNIAAHGWHLTTGFLGSAYVLPVLSDAGADDAAFRLLLTTSYPSWLYEVTHGATTTWERWNGDHGDPGMNSYSHYAFGAVGEWLYRYLAGIDQAPDAVAFDHIVVRPGFPTALDSVGAAYRSMRGVITSAWRRNTDGTVTVTVTIPANASGRVELPHVARPAPPPGARYLGVVDGRDGFAVGAGRYRFVLPAAAVQ
jgi:alpha-L-rhamnosidase